MAPVGGVLVGEATFRATRGLFDYEPLAPVRVKGTAGPLPVRLVTVTGEPGVGKSRLVREFRAFVDAQPELVAWRQGHCLPYGKGISFWALGEVLKAQAGILEFDGPATVAAKLADALAAAVEEPADRQWLEARLAPLPGGDGGQAAAGAGAGGPALGR